jgi:hypothetical protein
MRRSGPITRKAPLQARKPLPRVKGLSARGFSPELSSPSRAGKPETPARKGFQARSKPLPFRSAKTARIYVTRRQIVAEMFAEPSICEVPWCTDVATDPHEPLTRARGGDILDRAGIRKVCNPHNVMFSADEQPWMYRLGFLIHSWDRKAGAA